MPTDLIAPIFTLPTATVIIVAYESGAFLQPCVDALAAQTHQTFSFFEAVIVDNASSDGSVRDLRLPDDRFRILSAETNTGFAVANNLAAAGSSAEFLVLLNPDAVAEPAWLQTLIDKAHTAPDIASVGSLQRRL